jgi:hypothetical protein
MDHKPQNGHSCHLRKDLVSSQVKLRASLCFDDDAVDIVDVEVVESGRSPFQLICAWRFEPFASKRED